MSKLLSLLLIALLTFDVGLVLARPQSFQFADHSPVTPVDFKGLNTNTKRFAAGLPPLPPTRRKPSGVEAARRSVTSQCAKSGVIEVINADTTTVAGYISRDLTNSNQHYGLVKSMNDAGRFYAGVFITGPTPGINIQQVGLTGSRRFLAGLIQQNQPLGDGDGDDKAAILGRSEETGAGDPPQADKDPSFNNRDAESAIWTYDRGTGDNSLFPSWVNYRDQTPASPPAFISYLENGDKFYLTDRRAAPINGIPVIFLWISVDDQCGDI